MKEIDLTFANMANEHSGVVRKKYIPKKHRKSHAWILLVVALVLAIVTSYYLPEKDNVGNEVIKNAKVINPHTFETLDGNVWETEEDTDYKPGDKVNIKFDTLGTDDVTDDIILSVSIF